MKIDLNADLGESYGPYTIGDDEAMLDIVSSANVACGFHGGDPSVMTLTVERCMARGVAIGAHPGFRDIEGFGRRRMVGVSDAELAASIIYQIGALDGVARAQGASLSHVKLHGALANMASEDLAMATVCMSAVRAVDASLPVLAMASTALESAATSLGIRAAREIYADRAYNDDGTLVSRSHPEAIIHDPSEARDRVLEIVETGHVTSINGTTVPVSAESVCVHGDHPESVRIAEAVRGGLETAGYTVASF